MIQRLAALVILAVTLLSQPSQRNDAAAQSKPRDRDLGIALDGTPVPLNAITDVQGVEVGYATLVSGEGKREVGKGPVRTGVTAVLPRGRATLAPVFAAFTIGNGNGDMTGTHWVDESGVLETPILITNTLSVGVVRDAVVSWMVKRGVAGPVWYPVVAETSDGDLNDTPDSSPLSLLFTDGFEDVMSHPDYPEDRPGTYQTGLAGDKLDYLIMSPKLQARLQTTGIERRGSYHPNTWEPFDTVTKASEEASDHHLLWADFNFTP